MAIGSLQLKPGYINYQHPNQKWSDEPENAIVNFQFDPNDVKFSVQTRWKRGNKDKSVDGDLNIPWEYGEGTPDSLDIKLTLSDSIAGTGIRGDRSPAQNTSQSSRTRPADSGATSTQRAMEILEAMALPLRETWFQRLAYTYEDKHVLELPPGFGRNRNFDFTGGTKVITEGWYKLYTTRYQKSVKFTQRTEVEGTRLVEHNWHPPRPLLLNLFHTEPWECVIKSLQFDVVTMDTETGNPTGVIVVLTFAEWADYNLGNGLVIVEGQNVEEVKSLKDFNRKVVSGEIKRTIPPKHSLIGQYELSRTRPSEK